MTLRTWPAGVPTPAEYRFAIRERRRAGANEDDPPLFRAFARDPVVDAQVRWRFKAAEMAAFDAWFNTDLALGARWFTVDLPGRGGMVARAARFIGAPRLTHIAAGIYDVAATLEVQELAPSIAVPVPPYAGAILSLCQCRLASWAVDYQNRDASPAFYFAPNPWPELLYGFVIASSPQDLDYRDTSYARVVPFVRGNSNAYVKSIAYDNDFSPDYASHSWQLLDAAGNNIFRFDATGSGASFGITATRTVGAGSPVLCSADGPYPTVNLKFTFTDTSVIATDQGGTYSVDSFTVGADVASALWLKVFNGRAYISHSTGINLYAVRSLVAFFPKG